MGERPAVSVFRIAKSKNDYVEYIMHITDRTKKSRKKSKSESCVKKPEEKYMRLPQTGRTSMSNATPRDG